MHESLFTDTGGIQTYEPSTETKVCSIKHNKEVQCNTGYIISII